MMSLWDALRMNMMISYQELVRTFPSCLLYNRIIIHNHDDYVVLMAGEIDECGP